MEGRGVVTTVRRGEWSALLLSGAYFFLLLFGYFLLRPIREAMGVQRSMDDLRWLFVVTCAASLVITLLFGDVVSRFSRRRFIPIATRAVIFCLCAFIAARLTAGDASRVWTGYVFYVWLSVVNLFLTSVFWAFMADVWRFDQSKRLYPLIGVGGTLGALAASMLVAGHAATIGPIWLMAASGLCFEATVRIMRRIDAAESLTADHREASAGGQWIDGVRAIVSSPYLLGIGGYIVLMTISSTLVYFTGVRLVADAEEALVDRIALFGQLDMWTQLATLIVQIFVTARLIRWLGVGWTLAILPIVTVLGFAALAWIDARPNAAAWGVFAVFATFNAAHRATRYAVARPARETLFSVTNRAEKYKAKPVIDVFLYRGGDVAGVGVEKAATTLIVGLGGMLVAVAPLAALWGGLALWLATKQQQRADETVTE